MPYPRRRRNFLNSRKTHGECYELLSFRTTRPKTAIRNVIEQTDLGDVMVGPQNESVGAGEHGGPGATLDQTVGEEDGAGEEEDALEQPH